MPFVPVFYVVTQRLGERLRKGKTSSAQPGILGSQSDKIKE
jgi:hypothetical protein